MTREELKAWLAEIDLAKGDGLLALRAALCVRAPKGSTRGDRSKRRFLRRLVNRRIRQWENRPRPNYITDEQLDLRARMGWVL